MMFKENEFVFLTDEKGNKHWLKLSDGMMKIGSLGTVDGSKIMGSEDGGTIKIAGKEFTVFKPMTTDLMASVDRGAQIITPKDAATIIMNCNISSGDTVLEIGVGSGAMTTALLRAVVPTGRVHTIELREDHAEQASKNIKRASPEGAWTYQIGDAKTAVTDVTADAIVMDMPDPWLAFDNLIGNLRSGGMICAYIPNTNQLEESVKGLRERNFYDVFALENIQRRMEVHPGGVRPAFSTLGHTGYLVFGRKRSLR